MRSRSWRQGWVAWLAAWRRRFRALGASTPGSGRARPPGTSSGPSARSPPTCGRWATTWPTPPGACAPTPPCCGTARGPPPGRWPCTSRGSAAGLPPLPRGHPGGGRWGAGLLLGAGPGGGCRLDDGAYGPGADEIRQAEALLEAARGDLASAARRLAASLRSRAANVPKPVSMWAVPRHQSWEFLKGLGDSVRHTVVSLQKNALWMACPPLAATRQALQFAQTASSSLQHPKEAGKAAIYWDMWQHHPAKAAGELTPDVALLLVPELKSQLIAAREARAAQALEDMDNASGGHFFARHGGPDVDRGPTSTSTHGCDTGRCAACFEKRNSLPHPCRSTKGGATSKSDFHIHSADCLQVRHGSDRRRRLPGWRHSIS